MNAIMRKARALGLSFWLAVCAGVLMFVLIGQGVARAGIGKLGADVAEASEALAAPVAREDAEELEHYESIAKSGHFGKEKPPPKPKLFGILGRSAYMGESLDKSEPYEADAELPGGYKLVEVGANSVVIEKDGKKETLTVFPELGDKVAPGPGRSRRPAPPKPGPKPEAAPGAAPPIESLPQMPSEMRIEGHVELPPGFDAADVPEEIRARMEERMREMMEQRGRGE